jgi:hypothetical protein
MVVVPQLGKPRRAGSCRTTISTAIPANTPVITDVERNSAIHPSRSRPTRINSAPTISATAAITLS